METLIFYEHFRLLHARPTLESASLAQQLCIVCGHHTIRAKIRSCVMCKRIGARVKPQVTGQLPVACLNPRDIFDNTGVDYTGPIYIKSRHMHKPVIIK